MSSEGQSRRPSLVLILLLRSGWEAQVPGQPCGELRDRTPAQSPGKATPTHAFPVGGRLAGWLAQCPSGCTGSSSVPALARGGQVPWPSAGRGSLPVSHPGALRARVLGGRNQVAPAVTVHCPHLRLCVTPGLVVSPKGQAWGKARRLDDGAQTRGSDPASGGGGVVVERACTGTGSAFTTCSPSGRRSWGPSGLRAPSVPRGQRLGPAGRGMAPLRLSSLRNCPQVQ